MIKMVSPKWPWMAAQAMDLGADEDSGNRSPVVLVHGIFDTENAMRSWKKLLREHGYETFSITFNPANGHASISELAAQLDAFVREQMPGGRRFHLVGHSMGGLVMRCYAQRFDSAQRICGFVTLGSPHRGSWWANTLPRPGCVDMRADSELLKELEAGDAKLAALQPLSIWTPFDLMILPCTSSVWAAATNERCWLPSHPNLKHSRWLTARVVDYLKEREPRELPS